MAAPIFGSAGAIAAAEAISVNVPYPSGIAANDILILLGLTKNNIDILVPTDFTADAGNQQTSGASLLGEWFWKRATGSESGTLTMSRASGTGAPLAGVMARFTGCVTSGTPYEAATKRDSVGTTFTPADTTTLGADRLALALAVAAEDLLALGNYTGGTATVTERVHVEFDLVNDGTLHIADATVASASTFDYGSQTVGNQAQAIFSLALIPVVGADNQPPPGGANAQGLTPAPACDFSRSG
jgi:hypothetical protein